MTEPAAIPRPDVVLPAPAQPLAPLYSPGQIILGVVLGTPLAAGVMWRANLVALGRARPWLALVAGAAATGILVGVGMLVTRPMGFIPVVLAMSLRQPAALAFPPALVEAGGRHSWWRAVGVTMLSTLALLVAVVGGLAVDSVVRPLEVRVSAHEAVHYDDSDMRPAAERVAHALSAAGVFTGHDSNEMNVEDPHGPGYAIAAQFPEGTATDGQQAWAADIAGKLAAQLHACVTARTVAPGIADTSTVAKATVCP